jgi:hypothetical protein
MNFDPSPFVQIMDVRSKTADRKQLRATEIASQYLQAIEQVTSAVDTMQSSGA